MGTYRERFYRDIEAGSLASATEIVPFVLRLVQPNSVIDVGCGVATWLRVFEEQGIADVLGVDGFDVPAELLQIPAAKFRRHDLRAALTLDRTFDLAISLEVAEHLPASSAQPFVASLVRLAPVVLFSAAVPQQGGDGHLNEQWPGYWADLFQAGDYVPVDVIRPAFWESSKVDWWYRQNCLIYVKRDLLQRYPLLAAEAQRTRLPLAVVHPAAYVRRSDPRRLGLRKGLQAVAAALPGVPRQLLAQIRG